MFSSELGCCKDPSAKSVSGSKGKPHLFQPKVSPSGRDGNYQNQRKATQKPRNQRFGISAGSHHTGSFPKKNPQSSSPPAEAPGLLALLQLRQLREGHVHRGVDRGQRRRGGGAAVARPRHQQLPGRGRLRPNLPLPPPRAGLGEGNGGGVLFVTKHNVDSIFGASPTCCVPVS